MTRSRATDPVPLLRDMIRINTTNPPGGENACVAYLERLLADTGAELRIVGPTRERTNLVARFPGRGAAPPLLLHGHSDVVPVAGQEWIHPPFEGRVVDGHVWGRGAIDMKGGLAMMLAALFRLRESGERPAGDIMLAVVADEEHGSGAGARYLVDNYPELFDGIRCAIGEEAGAGIELAGLRMHPIVVAEKRACWLRVTLRGPGGHGSRLAPAGTPMAQLGRLLTALTGSRLPRHQVPVADRMLADLTAALPDPLADRVARVRADGGEDARPAGLPLDGALYLDSVLRHTVNPTIVRTSEKINVVPAEITVDLDGRILPGDFALEDFLGEVRQLIGAGVTIELLHEGLRVPQERIAEPEFGGFYATLVGILTKTDSDGVPMPMITPASTDASFFGQLGIRCYGWLPMRLPAGSDYRRLLHSANERIPIDALQYGTECVTELLRSYR